MCLVEYQFGKLLLFKFKLFTEGVILKSKGLCSFRQKRDKLNC